MACYEIYACTLYIKHEQILLVWTGSGLRDEFDDHELVGVIMALSSTSAVLANPSVGIG